MNISDIGKLLISKGVKNYNSTMVCALEKVHIEVVKLMLEKGANNYDMSIEYVRKNR